MLQVSAGEEEHRLQTAEAAELLLSRGGRQQEQAVPLVLPLSPVQTLRERQAGAAAGAHVPHAQLMTLESGVKVKLHYAYKVRNIGRVRPRLRFCVLC